MTDIVERLRAILAHEHGPDDPIGEAMGEAADEIARLRAEIARLAANDSPWF
jgi:hypothetical protein